MVIQQKSLTWLNIFAKYNVMSSSRVLQWHIFVLLTSHLSQKERQNDRYSVIKPQTYGPVTQTGLPGSYFNIHFDNTWRNTSQIIQSVAPFQRRVVLGLNACEKLH